MLLAWREREPAKELLRADPSNSNLRKSPNTTGKGPKRLSIEAVLRFFGGSCQSP